MTTQLDSPHQTSELLGDDASTEPTKTARPSSRFRSKQWLLSFLPLLSTLPLLLIQVGELFGSAQFFLQPWLALIVLVVIGVRLSRSNIELTPRTTLTFQTLNMLCLILVFTGLLLYSPPLGVLAACLTLSSRVALSSENWKAKGLQYAGIGVFGLILLMPAFVVGGWTETVQSLALKTSSFFLDLSEVYHFVDGNTLVLEDKTFYLSELCSGLSSLGLMLSLTALIAILHRTNWLQGALLIGLAMVWAILFEIARISVPVFAHAKLEMSQSDVLLGGLLDIGAFFVLLLLVYSSYHFVSFLLNPITKPTPVTGDYGRFYNPYSGFWNKILLAPESIKGNETTSGASVKEEQSTSVVAAFPNTPYIQLASCLLLGVCLFGMMTSLVSDHGMWVSREDAEIAQEQAMGEALNELKREKISPDLSFASQLSLPVSLLKEETDEDAPWGNHSKIWQVGHATDKMTISLAFPYPGIVTSAEPPEGAEAAERTRQRTIKRTGISLLESHWTGPDDETVTTFDCYLTAGGQVLDVDEPKGLIERFQLVPTRNNPLVGPLKSFLPAGKKTAELSDVVYRVRLTVKRTDGNSNKNSSTIPEKLIKQFAGLLQSSLERQKGEMAKTEL